MPDAAGAASFAPSFKSQQQEVRLAVVMYGGVSLAIYMNGVTQELFRLVRATAPAPRGKRKRPRARAFRELEGTERVYRKLAQIIQRGREPLGVSPDYEHGVAPPAPGRPVNAASPILTSFVVDIISGTSAGGINGVFLAKALANRDQDLTGLKNLWVEKGDLGELLNDKRRTRRDRQTQSLLDGGYMYDELLKALESMEASAGRDGAAAREGGDASPYIKELDLYVTTTDISGLMLPLRLAGGVVSERRHRNVFHFSYATEQTGAEPLNHFARAFNPFLAFAARCTSSFPVAFPPMRLRDIDDAVRASPLYADETEAERARLLSTSDRWRDFYPDYMEDSPEPGAARGDEAATRRFVSRSFGDGGYLDNKPFGYATDTLLRRRADLPVDRKLIFVDPDPQSPLADADFDRDVDVLKNTLSALAPTASTETIREDIQRINERNRLIERIRHFVDGVENDVRWRKAGAPVEESPAPVASPDTSDASAAAARQYAEKYLEEMVKKHGIAYGGYHRIKVAALTDELTTIIVRAANLKENSDEFGAVRDLVRAWRDATYSISREDSGGRLPQSRFIADFDIAYRLRRLDFVRAKIDELTCLTGAELRDRLDKLGGGPLPAEVVKARRFEGVLRATLRKVRLELSGLHFPLLRARLSYQRRGGKNPLRAPGHDLIAPLLNGEANQAQPTLADVIGNLLSAEAGDKRYNAARAALEKNSALHKAFDDIAEHLAADFNKQPYTRRPVGAFKKPLIEAAFDSERVLRVGAAARRAASPVESWVRSLLHGYYEAYENYDQVIFPVMYETEVGETDEVEVIRVSPYDAVTLINEKTSDEKERDGERARRKLGGTAFGHFGAFLKREWRTNDILWGRLDAAESLICALLPGEDAALANRRDSLIEEAQNEILKEELLNERKREGVRAEVIRLLVKANSTRDEHAALQGVREQLARSPLGAGVVRDFFESCADPSKLVGYFKDENGYEVDRRLDPQMMVQLMARSSRVFGRMLAALAENRRVDSKHVAWVTRLAQVFWGVVEVAVPGNFWNQFFHHIVHLLYAFEAFLIVGGVLLVDANIQRFGLISLAVTAAAHVAVKALGDYMSGKGYKFWHALVSVFSVLAGATILTSAALGLPELQHYWQRLNDALLTVTAIKRLHALPSEASALVLFGAGALAVVVLVVVVGGSWQAVKEFVRGAAQAARAVYYRVTGRARGESAGTQ